MAEIIISGPAGRLESVYHQANDPKAPIAIFLHPHPEHGGTMNNKVVFAMYQTFRRRGFSCLRINFRGVGKSQGQYDRGEGELADAAAALDWMQKRNPQASSIWAAGFSFGGWIAMQLLMRRPEIDRFVVAAPPANLYDFTFLAPCPSSGLFTQGDADGIVSLEAVHELAAKLCAQKDIYITEQIIPGADHFFAGRFPQLVGSIDGYITAGLGQLEEERSNEAPPAGLIRPKNGGAPYDPKKRAQEEAAAANGDAI